MNHAAKKRRRRAKHRRELARRRGVVLIIVLVVIVLLSLSTYAFTRTMLSNHQATLLNGRIAASRQLVASGVDSVRLFLLNDEATRTDAGGIYNNPTIFQAVPVIESDILQDRANFTVVAPAIDDAGNLAGIRYGLEDASNRLNLNSLLVAEEALEGSGRDLLLALPGMTEDIADAVLDWIDEDDESRDYGAEFDYYSTLMPPYEPRNAPLQSVEELLKVAGVTPQLLFGMDTNRNGMIDDHELNDPLLNASLQSSDSEEAAEIPPLGWASMLTIHSKENNVTKLGDPRIYLNGDDLGALSEQLNEVLDAEAATFILAYRIAGPYTGTDAGEAANGRQLDLSQEAKTELSTVLDLVGAKVQVTFQGQQGQTILDSPFSSDILAMPVYLPILMDAVTTTDQPAIPGRININQCSATLLAGIPGMDEDIAQQIIAERPLLEEAETADEEFQSETWIMTSGIVTLEQMRTLMPFVTTGGSVYQAQIVGYYEDGGMSSRAEVVFDATTPVPSVLFWRDISHLGRGYPIDLLGAQLMDIQ